MSTTKGHKVTTEKVEIHLSGTELMLLRSKLEQGDLMKRQAEAAAKSMLNVAMAQIVDDHEYTQAGACDVSQEGVMTCEVEAMPGREEEAPEEVELLEAEEKAEDSELS